MKRCMKTYTADGSGWKNRAETICMQCNWQVSDLLAMRKKGDGSVIGCTGCLNDHCAKDVFMIFFWTNQHCCDTQLSRISPASSARCLSSTTWQILKRRSWNFLLPLLPLLLCFLAPFGPSRPLQRFWVYLGYFRSRNLDKTNPVQATLS